jgi:hypothetical protein
MHLALQYITWHYSRGIRDSVVLWSNFIWFLSHFFSIPLLAATLFSPWKRLHEDRKKGFDIEDFFAVIIVNVMMRAVGFVMRISMIAIGLIVLTVALVLMVIHLALWILLPIVIPLLLYYGTGLLFS